MLKFPLIASMINMQRKSALTITTGGINTLGIYVILNIYFFAFNFTLHLSIHEFPLYRHPLRLDVLIWPIVFEESIFKQLFNFFLVSFYSRWISTFLSYAGVWIYFISSNIYLNFPVLNLIPIVFFLCKLVASVLNRCEPNTCYKQKILRNFFGETFRVG